MIFRYTRFTKIYNSREEAIKKLDNTKRYYAENVAIRYYKDGKAETILALFRSENTGDYDINFDSSDPTGGGGIKGIVLTRGQGQSDMEVINAYYFGKTPKEGDLVIIKPENTTYIYLGQEWLCISGGGSEEKVKDVRINGSSIVEDGIADIDLEIFYTKEDINNLVIDCGEL
jgi:hypothetical protein